MWLDLYIVENILGLQIMSEVKYPTFWSRTNGANKYADIRLMPCQCIPTDVVYLILKWLIETYIATSNRHRICLPSDTFDVSYNYTSEMERLKWHCDSAILYVDICARRDCYRASLLRQHEKAVRAFL